MCGPVICAEKDVKKGMREERSFGEERDGLEENGSGITDDLPHALAAVTIYLKISTDGWRRLKPWGGDLP